MTKMKSYIVDSRSLMSYLNIAYKLSLEQGFAGGIISVKPPFLGDAPFMTIRLKKDNAEVQVYLNRKSYNDRINALQSTLLSRFGCKIELPTAVHVKDSLYMSGVIKPRNWDLLVNRIIELSKRDPFMGQKLGFLFFDTNALRMRFSQHVLEILARNPKAKIGYLLLTGVREEIINHIKDKKYTTEHVEALSDSLLYGSFAGKTFLNQSVLDERLWRLALNEYMKIKKLPTSQEIESNAGDEAFMRTIMEFEKSKNVDVLLVTQDDLFAQKAVARGIETIRLDLLSIDETFEKTHITEWKNISQLIYVQAIIYGVIKADIGGVKTHVYGIWAGKKKDDWEREHVKIESDNKKFIEKAKLMIEPLLSE